MSDENILVLNGDQILTLLQNRELEIMQVIKSAYKIYEEGNSFLPHSSFLRFPDNINNRIIALPAYLNGDLKTAGIKWIASFPDNLAMNMERASAVLILNSTENGRPQAMMESSVISAKRTAASAVIAANCLQSEQLLTKLGMIGCGLINFETLRFLIASHPEIESLFIYDLSLARAEQFKLKCKQLSKKLEILILEDPNTILQIASLISFATTASKPHIFDMPEKNSDKIILHISLRDLSPEFILLADNIVDDIDHVCRAETSIHLAEQLVGNRNFIRCTIGSIFNSTAQPRQDNKIAVFSPFGLGILDLALGKLAYDLAIKENKGTIIKSFFPVPWLQRK
ncbi:2,3-diaminopropionate biosynthesis protein SbnB [Nostoc sp. 'Peltigera membranacea cyanobiont' 213]|uniref:2,3-diaminopropionate biosynthesis protein SbnB n=1 Tax=Nostoc sp. 'Peltigera membranacea cyanobiont' 213 TaxID=2014530 RepID=UPI000B956566|nr:2,3-diaminopropionate biosynthesis protein SbnB [Nostoc sp. 'Peltigera membranacea cyanobiont' 213]OYD87119.1 2,3-diaminopropionate biosynthesis protein SbnB [Nostoc sp. 'Peltigera membranacea cyanobiont' 213]